MSMTYNYNFDIFNDDVARVVVTPQSIIRGPELVSLHCATGVRSGDVDSATNTESCSEFGFSEVLLSYIMYLTNFFCTLTIVVSLSSDTKVSWYSHLLRPYFCCSESEASIACLTSTGVSTQPEKDLTSVTVLSAFKFPLAWQFDHDAVQHASHLAQT
jgi:hypothetical protein